MAIAASTPAIFLTSSEKIFGNEVQACYMPTQLMTSIQAKPGDFTCIRTSCNKGIVCKIIPVVHSSCHLGYQVITSCHVLCNVTQIKDFSVKKESKIEGKDVCVVNTVDIVTVDLSIVSNSVEAVMNAKKYPKSFENGLRYLLKMYKFMNKCLINCTLNPLAKLLGILYIIINDLKLQNKGKSKNEQVGKITNTATINISNIQSIERHLFVVKNETFLGGIDHILEDLKSLVNDPWDFKEEFAKAGVLYPKGVLLIGPPGCGKSSLVRQLCHQTQACLIATAGAEIQSPFEGEARRNFTKVAKKACTLSREGPCIFFIDEIDSVCPQRSDESNAQALQLTAQVLLTLDECRKYPYLLVMAATNRPYALDSALRRSGRLEIEILLNAPTIQDRLSILKIHAKSFLPEDHPSLKDIAEATPGFVGADLELLCDKVRQKFFSNGSAAAVSSSEPTIDTETVCSEMLHLCSKITPSIHKTLEFITAKPNSRPIGGLDSVRERLSLLLSHHTKYKEFYKIFKLKRPKGILLYGPRGCGKTRLVSLLASQRGFTFLSANASHLLSAYVGDSEKRIAALFHSARVAQPSIVFIDEIDGIFGSRSTVGGGVRVNLLSELLQAMDGADVGATSLQGSSQIKNKIQELENEVVVCAATNNPQKLDSALLRPGRFDHVIYVPPPDIQARKDILKLKTSKLKVNANLLEKIATEAELWTGAELENLISRAAMQSVVENSVDDATNQIVIRDEILEREFDRISPSLTAEELRLFEKFEKKCTNQILGS